MKSLLIVLILMSVGEVCGAQSNFEFVFGEGLKFESLISQNNKKGEPLKWINVNTNKDTWTVKGGSLIDSGEPIGVVRSEKQYENFILHIEWKHMDPGGNSGVFVWSNGATIKEGNPYPNGVEVQILDPDWINIHKNKDGEPQTKAYISGEMWGVNGLTTTPDNPRGERSKGLEYRVKDHGIWNAYDVVCVDGVIKLAVNENLLMGLVRLLKRKDTSV